jgi:FtsZ-interacting cell division protein ZipA
MKDNNLTGIIVVIIIIIIIILVIWWIFSSKSDKSDKSHKSKSKRNKYSDGQDRQGSNTRNYSVQDQNGYTQFESVRSFRLDQDHKFTVVLPKTSGQEQSYVISAKIDFSESKISIQTPNNTPDGKTADGYVTEIRHHIFEDSLVYNTSSNPIIQPEEINRRSRSGSTRISLKKTEDNNLEINFEISPGVVASGSVTIRLNSLSPPQQTANNFAVV